MRDWVSFTPPEDRWITYVSKKHGCYPIALYLYIPRYVVKFLRLFGFFKWNDPNSL
jgi:hypothetical protein